MGSVSRLLRSVGLKPKKQKRPPTTLLKKEDIKQSVEHAERVFSISEQFFRDRGFSVAGCDYLEVGPGGDFGVPLLMADRGASVTVADRFLAPWDADYHPAFYRDLLARVGRSPSIERVIEQLGYDGVITLVSAAAEDLHGIPDATFDIIVSSAVLEHLYDVGAAAREMRRVSKPRAVHSHQVDFRDHKDFARPLECLLLSQRKFKRLSARINFESGCQTRPLELVNAFQHAGYTVNEAIVSHYAAEEYLDNFMPRLRRASLSPYRTWSRDDLRVVSACFWMTA